MGGEVQSNFIPTKRRQIIASDYLLQSGQNRSGDARHSKCSNVAIDGAADREHLTQTDWGTISPKNSTAVTDTTMVANGDSSLSRNSGKACRAWGAEAGAGVGRTTLPSTAGTE